VIKHSTTKGTQ